MRKGWAKHKWSGSREKICLPELLAEKLCVCFGRAEKLCKREQDCTIVCIYEPCIYTPNMRVPASFVLFKCLETA